MGNINNQLKELVRKGYRAEDAALALGIDVDVANLAIQQVTMPGRSVTLHELIENFKPKAAEILMEIAQDPDVKAADRVKACQIMLNGEGQLPEINAFDLGKKMIDFQAAVNRARQMPKVIEAEAVNG